MPVVVLLARSLQTAALAQLAALGATVAVALAGGAFCALVVCAIPNLQGKELIDALYDDRVIFMLEYDGTKLSWQRNPAALAAEQVQNREHAEVV